MQILKSDIALEILQRVSFSALFDSILHLDVPWQIPALFFLHFLVEIFTNKA